MVGGDVVGVVVDESGELGEGGGGVALGVVLHGEAVAGEIVGGVGGEDFGEGGDLVHELMVRGDGAGWQVFRTEFDHGLERGARFRTMARDRSRLGGLMR